MLDVDRSAQLAEALLAEALPRRWRHVRSVARRARWVAKQLSLSEDLVTTTLGRRLARPGMTSAWYSPPAGEPRSNRATSTGAFTPGCARAGVRRIRVHDTRHTCGSLLAALDVHPRVAMQILRHSKISITMEIYTEVPAASTREALKRLGETLG